MGMESMKGMSRAESTEIDPQRAEFDRIIKKFSQNKEMLEILVERAMTLPGVKDAIERSCVEGGGGDTLLEPGGYLVSDVDNHVVSESQVQAAIDSYVETKSWQGFGGDLPQVVRQKIESMYGTN